MAVPIYGGFPLWDEQQQADPYAGGWAPFQPRSAALDTIGQGLAGLGAGLLSGRNWGEGLSRGLLAANQGMQQAGQDARRDYYVDQQGRYMQRRMQQEDRQAAREDEATRRKAASIEALAASPPAGVDPQRWAAMVAADPEGMAGAYGKSLFEKDGAPKTVGGMMWNGSQYVPIPGYTEQAAAIAAAGRAPPAQINIPKPPPTIEERDQQVLLQGDPASPEYAMAYTRTFLTPRYVQTDKGVVPIMPPVPPNIRPPTYAAAGQPAQSGSMTPQAAGAIPGTAPPMNQDQANAAGFADRMSSANAVLDQLGQPGQPFVPGQVDSTASGLPGSNYTTSAQWKSFDQARRNFINAQLRRESGAAISASEFDSANAQYFPVPNDPPEVLQQKAQNRAQAIANMKRAAGPQYKPDQGAPAPSGKIEYRFENGVLVPVTPGAAPASHGAAGRW